MTAKARNSKTARADLYFPKTIRSLFHQPGGLQRIGDDDLHV
jgi:hypothetical protein